MEQKGPAGLWGAQEDVRGPAVLQGWVQGASIRAELCRVTPRRDAQPKAEASSQLPCSRNPLWRMLQLHLCPGVEVCWRRSRRWADKITEAKAVRE